MSTLMSSHVVDIDQGNTHRSTTVSTTAPGGDDSDYESVRCSSSSSESCTRVVIMSVDEEGGDGDGDGDGERLSEKNRSLSSSSSSSDSFCLSEVSVEETADLESGGGGGGGAAAETAVVESKVSVHLSKVERDCRICHLSLDGSNPDSGLPIELGCSCKEDLAAAHKHCAEAWFKIRGNKTCEICGSTAHNVVGVNEVEQSEQWYEANDAITTIAQPQPGETRHFWQGHRFLNFLLACMVFAFVISWLFHFNVPS